MLQRVTEASVTVGDELVGRIGGGLVVLLGIGPDDSAATAREMAAKVAHLRIFSDKAGKFNLSALDLAAEVLVVSQFTLYADASRGRRPSFTSAAAPAVAAPLVDVFAEHLRLLGLRVECGRFGAHMLVRLTNDGPVTLVLDA